ncbi:unnamed protein product, partial [Ectocarpus sp. 6 AP-2014]
RGLDKQANPVVAACLRGWTRLDGFRTWRLPTGRTALRTAHTLFRWRTVSCHRSTTAHMRAIFRPARHTHSNMSPSSFGPRVLASDFKPTPPASLLESLNYTCRLRNIFAKLVFAPSPTRCHSRSDREKLQGLHRLPRTTLSTPPGM